MCVHMYMYVLHVGGVMIQCVLKHAAAAAAAAAAPPLTPTPSLHPQVTTLFGFPHTKDSNPPSE